jgi:hypothetical protein
MAKVTENVPKRITLKISEVKSNPNNPRVIKDEKFKSLVKSIQDFPEMAEIRPIVVNADMIILGGNMRFKAMKEAGWKEVPVIVADHLTPEQEREFIIKDNTSGGDWDWEMLAMEWDADKLEEWGLDLPKFAEGHDANNMNEDDLDLGEEFDPIGESKGQQRIVFIFKSQLDAESWINRHPEKNILVKRAMAWQVDLCSQSIS